MPDASGKRAALTVHLMGGLGNQLFQYAFGRRLALLNDAELWLDARGYQMQLPLDQTTGLRTVEVGDFNIAAKIIYPGEILIERSARRRIRKIVDFGLRLAETGKPYHARREVEEPEENAFRFDPAVTNRRFSGSLSVRGFWQSERYFCEIESVLRKELCLRTELPRMAQDLIPNMRASSSVAVHVRHGDNATPTAALGMLPRAYYEEAMRAVSQLVTDPVFYVFSDDVAWAAEYLGHAGRFVYVSRVEKVRSSTDQFLMSCCRHHIIANSTFSWWGAWLGKKDGQIVFAPRRYYQNVDRPNPDLYPGDWRLL